jgi:hypothetical protein
MTDNDIKRADSANKRADGNRRTDCDSRVGSVLGGRLVVSGVIYWSPCVEGLISVGVVYIGS